MPNAPKNAAAKDMPFEEALKKLESIVETMESGEQPLEAMLVNFDEGVRLTKICQARLDEAELKVSKLEQNADGEPVLKPLSESPTDDE